MHEIQMHVSVLLLACLIWNTGLLFFLYFVKLLHQIPKELVNVTCLYAECCCVLFFNYKTVMTSTLQDGTGILSLVMCGSETWSLTLNTENRIGIFENKVFRKTFGPGTDDESG
jgi:hypothetical protein